MTAEQAAHAGTSGLCGASRCVLDVPDAQAVAGIEEAGRAAVRNRLPLSRACTQATGSGPRRAPP